MLTSVTPIATNAARARLGLQVARRAAEHTIQKQKRTHYEERKQDELLAKEAAERICAYQRGGHDRGHHDQREQKARQSRGIFGNAPFSRQENDGRRGRQQDSRYHVEFGPVG